MSIHSPIFTLFLKISRFRANEMACIRAEEAAKYRWEEANLPKAGG